MFLLLQMLMHLTTMAHSLMKGIGLSSHCAAELRDDGRLLCPELSNGLFSFGKVDLTLVQDLFACLPLGRSHFTEPQCFGAGVMDLGF